MKTHLIRWPQPWLGVAVTALTLAAILIPGGADCSAADKAKIQESIRKGQAYLLKQKLTGAFGSVAALAYVKAGGDKNNPAIQQVLRDVGGRFGDGTYHPSQHHTYEASIDLMLLEAMDPKQYKPQIEAAAAYIRGMQLENGSWYYPDRKEPDCGDTSIAQYAMLGLWTATRAGVDVPVEVWEKAVRWHIAKQMDDGGFCYHPFETKGIAGPEERTSVTTMTSAGTSSLLIIRRMLFGEVPFDPDVKQEVSKRRFGVLERITDEKLDRKRDVTVRIETIDDSLKKSIRWMINHFGTKTKRHETYFAYDLYSIERVAALLDVDELGAHNWYDEGCDELIARQAADGSWTDLCTNPGSTALSLMFLSKVTATIIKPKPRVNLLGGGLQAGGRGLPDNLDSVQVKDGNVSARKMVGAVDSLLIELERSSDAKVEDVQAAVVDAVQLNRPEELIGQIKRLRKLATDSRLEVRRTAIWALGRSGDVSAAPSLIRGLSDPDASVVREASLALCILSRRPEGCGKAIDPTDDSQLGLNDNTPAPERSTVLEKWRNDSIKLWTEWYLKNRSYDERDDRTALKKTNK